MKNYDCKQKKRKTKANQFDLVAQAAADCWFSFLSCSSECFSFLLKWPLCVYTSQRNDKRDFLFVWLKSKALLFLCALLLARSGNRQQNRCILCVASLKPAAAGQTDMLYCLWGKTKLLKTSGQISTKNPVVPWSFHCFFSIFLLFEVHL